MNRSLIGDVLLLLVICGCGSNAPTVFPVDKTRAKLQAISGAYMAATTQANRAPAKPIELLPFLGDASVTEEQKREKLRSDNDGEEFVIAWGVDFRKQAEDIHSRDVIFAYEKRGKGGQRYVLKLPTDIFVIPDDVFQKSQFSKGYEPSP
ncbi:hypothetical protein LBMAG52_18020 [Planctomycetia bacterium]|nr:hypothetical protein LBMAG52_18020 [Planctomycetia bacterium]